MDRSDMLQRKPETDAFLDQVIRHPFFKRAENALKQAHKTYGNKPRGIIILGESGTGKSTLIEIYLADHAVRDTDACNRQRVLYVEIPPNATLKDVVIEMLDQLGCVAPCKGQIPKHENLPKVTRNNMLRRVRQLLKELGVELIIVDEVNNLLRSHTGRSAIDVGDFFKSLINRLHIPLVLTGTPPALEVIKSNPELRRRLPKVEVLPVFKVKPKGSPSDPWEHVLRGVEKAMAVPTVSLTEHTVMQRLCLASEGILSHLILIIEETLEAADLSRPLTLKDYARGYGNAFLADAQRHNPFTAHLHTVEAELKQRGLWHA